jgi:hypothetical protein
MSLVQLQAKSASGMSRMTEGSLCQCFSSGGFDRCRISGGIHGSWYGVTSAVKDDQLFHRMGRGIQMRFHAARIILSSPDHSRVAKKAIQTSSKPGISAQ